MYERELVIAAYDRSLEWIDTVPKNVKITVYRKGNNYNNTSEIYIEKNIGRCVHTFFKHIYDRYDSLADLTFFAQDFPFDHWSNIIESLNNDILYIKNNCAIYHGEYYGFDTLHFNNTILSNDVGIGRVLISDKNGNPAHYGLPLEDVWKFLFISDMPTDLEFNPGGHFCASKKHLQNRSRNFYKKVKDLLEEGCSNSFIEKSQIPYCIERFENYIFNSKYITIL